MRVAGSDLPNRFVITELKGLLTKEENVGEQSGKGLYCLSKITSLKHQCDSNVHFSEITLHLPFNACACRPLLCLHH